MNILANILSSTDTNLANKSTSACAGVVWEEPVCPEEIL